MALFVRVAFAERTNGVAAEVEMHETGDDPDVEALLERAKNLAEKAQAMAVQMSIPKQMRGLR